MESGLVYLLTKLLMTVTLQVRFEVPHCSDCEDDYHAGRNTRALMIEIGFSEVSVHVPDFRMPHPERQKFPKCFMSLFIFPLMDF
jgi:hypothetical protein